MATVKKPIKKAANGTTTTKTTVDPKSRELIIKEFEDLQKKKDSIYTANRKLAAEKSAENAAYLEQQRSLKAKFNEAAKNRNDKLPRQKNGGSVKAKDGKWIQKAVNPKHKGYCTPMTKATCTPKRKALAKTFKAMAAKRKSK